MGKKLYCGNLSFNTSSSDLDQIVLRVRLGEERRSDQRPRHRPEQGLRLRRDVERRRSAWRRSAASTAKSTTAGRSP